MTVEGSPDLSPVGLASDSPPMGHVVCVIVSYRPEVEQLARLGASIVADGARAIVVDNTETPGISQAQVPADCEVISLGRNTGIAHAQNVGVARAREAGASIIVFFDQDSKFEWGFLPALVAPLRSGVPEITSPLFVDDRTGMALPSQRLGRWGLPQAVYGGAAAEPYPVDIVIASGTAATQEVFALAGGFDEALFIDGVDSEWCLRCRSKQIPIYVIPAAVMRHQIGHDLVRLGPFTIFMHSPTRCYYQVRNCFHLMRKRHVPFGFAFRHTISVVLNRLLALFLVSDRLAYIKAYLAGLRDGLKGVAGAKPR
ncbi:glycosyltransferase family 2 protein [Bradyrhizobium sp. CCGUVB14]|uniref:glycosyltransferase family 2 protein n=1 Tax=Bradyrhizobium sp. CCGUVB14 TaxID=2949628 RepID=UPI0020B1C216|nr:glycosyltransferase family 2 protein [Bradyrhizobium sp. CCGUVB14]MCP3445670.1 glycosyltransferase family 2 protein [Bradyrhizobium sp. CCGUVB14]